MSKFNLIMPKLGESVREATITKWFVKEGDSIEEDDPILEIATDKVDSEIPSPVEGVIEKILFEQDALVPVGEVIAYINTGGSNADSEQTEQTEEAEKTEEKQEIATSETKYEGSRFYSPLVKSIAKAENVSIEELESIEGSGTNNRVNKADILAFVENRKNSATTSQATTKASEQLSQTTVKHEITKINVSVGAEDEIVEMDRMRRLIADHMVASKHTAPHVTSMVEVDVSNAVEWRNKNKDQFFAREKEKITFLPIFIEAIAKALRDFPGVNASVDGYNVILRKNINIGVAVALDSGNLIVPVIKNADEKNLVGLAKSVNDLANRSRNNKLQPDEIQGSTITITNLGGFGNITGTPIINQPNVAILAVGAITKKPAVIETPQGDTIGIRHKMTMALSYDHRVVDGALGGMYLKRVSDYLENFSEEDLA